MAVNPFTLGGAGAAINAAIQQAQNDPVQRAKAQAAQAQNLAKQQAGQQALAQAGQDRVQQAQQVSSFIPEIPTDFWGLSDTSSNWQNPYYDPSIDPTQYARFDYNEPGSGIRTSGNLAAAFDQAFLAGIGEVNPLDLSGIGSAEDYLQNRQTGGLGGAFADSMSSQYGDITPELEKALAINNKFDAAKSNYDLFLNDEYYQDAFRQLGIDPASIQNREDLDAIDPLMKASVWDVVGRTKQAQNQIPKSGILDSLPGQIALGLAGLFNPYVAAGLGAMAGGMSGEGGLLGAAKGALNGYGIGSFTNGFTQPGLATGIDPRDLPTPDFTPGGNPAWTGPPPGAPGAPTNLPGPWGNGTIDLPDDFPTGPSAPNDPPPPTQGGGIPPISIPGGSGDIDIGPVIDDSTPEIPPDNNTPPVYVPPTGSGGSDAPDLPDIPTDPTQYNLSQTGLLNMGGRYLAKPIPGPAQALNYFGYNDNPFMRL